ncbi:6365_t:CDS:1, partial [Gigaspora margarita]
ISFEEKTLFVPQVNVQSGPSKLRSPISVLPKDPEERQQHVIKMVLEQFPYLTLKHSFKNNYFDFNRSVLCPLCNKNHKKEKIRSNIEGE